MKPKEMLETPVQRRRGTVTRETGAIAFLLVDATPDQVLDALLQKHFIGAARRNCLKQLNKGEVPRPSGPWGILVRLKGQPWTYFFGDNLQFDWPCQWARENSWRAAWFSIDGTINTKIARLYDGPKELFNFVCGMINPEKGFVFRKKVDELESAMIRGESDVCTKAWLDKIKSGGEALDLLARLADAYLPVSLGKGVVKGRASVGGWDGEPYPEDDGDTAPLPKSAFERVDVFTFGGPETLEPNPAVVAFSAAVRAGNATAVQKALAQGADPNLMSDDNDTPLEVALQHGSPFLGGLTGPGRFSTVTREQQLALLSTLLKAGADPDPPGHHPAIHWALHWAKGGDEQTIFHQLRLLLEHGANPNAEGTELFTVGMRPLHTIILNDQWLAVAKLLVKHGADLSLANRAGLKPRRLAEQRVAELSRSLANNPAPAGKPLGPGGLALALAEGLGTQGEDRAKTALNMMMGAMRGAEAAEHTEQLARLKALAAFLAQAEQGQADPEKGSGPGKGDSEKGS